MDAIYARQSVEKADSLSIQGQIDLCRRETGQQVRIYQDKGFSGKNTNRPAFRQLMEDVETGEIRKIVVYRLDRFSRSITDFGRLWDILKEHHVEFVSINETFDTATPMGRAMLNIVMVFAQLERETTAQRVRDNYYQRVKLGAWPGGPAPYGFSLGRQPGPDGKLAPGLCPNEQAAVVERIFQAYGEEGATLGSVARMLKEESVPGPRRATWDNVALSRILHSPLYVMADPAVYFYYKAKGVQSAMGPEAFDGRHGAMLLGKRDRPAGKYQDGSEQKLALANHLGFISGELWLMCQYKLEANRQLGRTGSGRHTWLSGLLKCGSCGYSVKVNRDKEKYYLVCSGRSNLKLCRQSIRVDLRELEQCVERELEALLEQCPQEQEQDRPPEGVEQALAALERKMDRLVEALAESSDLTVQYVNRTMGRLEEQRRKLLAERGPRQTRRVPQPQRIQMAALSFEQKKLVAAQFIQEIRLSEETAEVMWKV